MDAVTPRKLLGVSWCMPPALFPRSIQVGRLLKGLQRLGWRSDVVMPSRETRPKSDPIDASLAELYGRAYSEVAVDLSRVDPDFGAFLPRWRERWAGETGLTTDQLWLKRGIGSAIAAVKGSRPAVLVTFAQPWSDHRIGMAVKSRYPRLPWVAHFSDPWVDSPYGSDLPDEAKAADRRDEAAVVAHADRVVFTNEYASHLVMSKYKSTFLEKARVVPHAMDEELTAASQPPRVPGPVRLAYVGNLFVGRRRAHGIFEALANVHARHSLAGRLELIILGEGSGLYEAREKVFVLRLEEIVKFKGRVTHLESLAAMSATDVLVLIDAPAETNLFLPSKVADYLMARRPILALTPPAGPSADIMRALGYPVVGPDDVQAIEREIEALLARHAAGSLAPASAASDYTAQFGLSAVAKAFSTILDEATGGRR